MPLLLGLTLPTLTGTGTGTSIYCTALYNIHMYSTASLKTKHSGSQILY